LERTARLEPARFVDICSRLVPRDVQLTLSRGLPGLDADQWGLIVPMLAAIQKALPDANQREPADVLSFVLNAIKAASAKLIEPDCVSADALQAIEKDS
jgi:hypothetical protein